jgi:hypothetical protein
MLKEFILRGARGSVLLVDSITQLAPEDRGAIVVAASHGGLSSGAFALRVSAPLVFFNDAGVGKDGAGIAALPLLQARGLAAGAVAHDSARIGDARDMWQCGRIAHLNDAARALGLAEGETLADALARLCHG